MGQIDVLDYLEEQFKINPERGFTAREIAKALGKSQGSCTIVLKKLRERNEIEYHRGSSSRGNEPYIYRHKEEKDVLL